jgi:hypothetical protein
VIHEALAVICHCVRTGHLLPRSARARCRTAGCRDHGRGKLDSLCIKLLHLHCLPACSHRISSSFVARVKIPRACIPPSCLAPSPHGRDHPPSLHASALQCARPCMVRHQQPLAYACATCLPSCQPAFQAGFWSHACSLTLTLAQALTRPARSGPARLASRRWLLTRCCTSASWRRWHPTSTVRHRWCLHVVGVVWEALLGSM